MTSLFTAATKRAPLTAAVSDSAENRLTEILAAVLTRAPEAARKLVEEWTQEPPKGRLTVTPQRRTADGRYVDLELRYDEEGSRRTSLVWIEVKRDAGPSGEDQLWRYAWELRALLDNHQADSGHLVFLTRPHDWSELFEKFSAVGLGHLWPPKEATWPKLSAALTRWSRTSTEDRWKRELVREFVDYLQEEHVANEGLTLEGTIVLQRFQETDDAFATLLDETDNRLADWGRLEVYDAVPKRSSRAGWTDYYRTYTPLGEVASWGGDAAVLEWNFRRRAPRGRDRYCFAAGMTWLGPKEEAPWRGTREWPLDLEEFQDAFPRLYRWLQPEELAAKGMLDDQVDYLTGWVRKTFEALLAARIVQ
jgi:hypothetical protein